MSAQKYTRQIREYSDLSSLSQLWEKVKADEKLAEWPDGIAFEYLILRAFEISGAKITYPYSVELFGIKKVEQIDGMISIEDKNLFVITESKDWDRNTPVAPVTKMRNQLMRRPNSLIGSIFTATSFTESAVLLSHFLSPQTILLWNSEDIDYCFKNAYFLEGMDSKYQYAMKEGKPDFDLATNDPFKEEAPV